MADTEETTQTIGEQVIELAKTIAVRTAEEFNNHATNIQKQYEILTAHKDILNNHEARLQLADPEPWKRFREFYGFDDELNGDVTEETINLTKEEWEQIILRINTLETQNISDDDRLTKIEQNELASEALQVIADNAERIKALETHETADDNEWATRDFLKVFQDSINKE